MKNMEINTLFHTLISSSVAVISAFALFSAVSCSSQTVPNTIDVSESSSSEDNTVSDEKTSAADVAPEAVTSEDTDEETTKSEKDPNKYNTYSMEELFSKDSPLIGYWHTDGRDMYIEYNEFGTEGFTIFLLGNNFQIFSSEIGVFEGSPQNIRYELGSSRDDESIANLYNKATEFTMAVNDDNTVSVFVDFGFGKNSTYTLKKMPPSSEMIIPFTGDWGNSDGIGINFTYEEGSDTVDIQTLFGVPTDKYPIAIPSVGESEMWLCCPYIDGMLTMYSDNGVFYDAVNVHMTLNSDGTLVVEREYTNPALRNNSMLTSKVTLRKFA